MNTTKKKRQHGFTLLEVLMVIAMLAIVGGAIITSYGGLEDKAARGTSVHTMSSIEEAFRVFAATEGALPNNLESLIAATPTNPTYVPAELDNAANDATAGAHLAILAHGLEDETTVIDLDPAPLVAAGITKIRYVGRSICHSIKDQCSYRY